jgi:DNA-binding transcriptional LysR family regulator
MGALIVRQQCPRRSRADKTGHSDNGTTFQVTAGAPACLKLHGEPSTQGPRRAQLRVSGNFQSNRTDAVRAATLSGIGIALSPIWLFSDDIRAKRLKVLLTDYQPKPLPIHAVSPANRRYSAKVKAYLR